ncbi:DUF2526 family protein [Buttiauxella sp. B2]|uniref:DUF2526 family protein n=1 Tax=Buttiauxella sp. B2 TaxID=2587812 RepID=UPI00111F0BDD|nr:DUF2526 family protein [Buttiauxella sp. B2]TNV17934.1 DUF2526 family protein [Buttiauxella sp. B2]
MAHLEDVIARVDAKVTENVIEHMNELLIELSDDTELSREDRFAQQQRLRIAIAQKGHHHKAEAEQRREDLTKGGSII